MKALLVGDSEDITANIPFCLRLKWEDVVILSVRTGSESLRAVENDSPDVVMIDFTLPDRSGTDMIEKLREFSDVPLIVVIGDRSELERAEVLEAGADDYVVSAINPPEVLSKLTALFRRVYREGMRASQPTLNAGVLEIDVALRRVASSGRMVKMTPHEYELLVMLARNPGRALSHRILLERAWGPEYAAETDLLKTYISRLRRKLNDDADNPRIILTQRGIGYWLNPHA